MRNILTLSRTYCIPRKHFVGLLSLPATGAPLASPDAALGTRGAAAARVRELAATRASHAAHSQCVAGPADALAELSMKFAGPAARKKIEEISLNI